MPSRYDTPEKRAAHRREQDRYIKQKRREADPVFRENENAYQRQRTALLKAEFIAAYGGVCTCCGESEPAFLTCDHVNGRPVEHPRRGHGGVRLYAAAKREGYPATYTVLCFNCNSAKGIYGVCPHQLARLPA